MANQHKSSHEYICLNKKDREFLEKTYLEDLLDVEGRKNVPIRKDNVRKAIEHHLERQQLKRQIMDFDLRDLYEDEH